jgi:hypothetical protein
MEQSGQMSVFEQRGVAFLEHREAGKTLRSTRCYTGVTRTVLC